ncbi:unnamed protein product [Timema podura]|uniref:2'-phosphotransferase n=1 Tax=Timema podura TaxID=61482 RepID=A0ABN7NLA1_TIMPD|nr:unnamed protein product [Timema podura]
MADRRGRGGKGSFLKVESNSSEQGQFGHGESKPDGSVAEYWHTKPKVLSLILVSRFGRTTFNTPVWEPQSPRHWQSNPLRELQGRDIALSKLLSWSLRHGAEKEGLDITDDGFINVRDLLNHRLFRGKYTLEDIQRVVAENNKQRFYLRTNQDGGIFANKSQSGTFYQVNYVVITLKKITNLDLTPIIDERDFPVIIHGTYWQHWDQIRTEGLSRMNRLHIHFSPGEPGDSQVISGMRQSCQIYIYIDVRKALADGLKFYKSKNNVILSPGNERGYIRPQYFSQVVQVSPRKLIG